MLDVEYPEAALIAEWNGPRMSLKNGFDMDFYLNWQGNGYSWLMRNYDGAMDSNPHNIGKAYFCKTPAPALTNSWTSTCRPTRPPTRTVCGASSPATMTRSAPPRA